MFKPLKHPFVKILGGLPIFIGQTGVITDKEGKLYRVQLDQPVEVPNVGTVTNDLWEPAMLKVIRPPTVKPAKVAEAAAEMPEAAAPAEAAPEPAPDAAAPEAGTLAAPAADLPTVAASTPNTRKPKVLSAKAEAQQRAGVKVTDKPKAVKAQKARKARKAK